MSIHHPFLTEKEKLPMNTSVFDTLFFPIDFIEGEIYNVSELKIRGSEINQEISQFLFQNMDTIGFDVHFRFDISNTKKYLLSRFYTVDQQFEIILALVEMKNYKAIYWFSFLAKDTSFSTFDEEEKLNKGYLTNQGPLSVEYSSDSVFYKSYTEFVSESTIVKTEIIDENKFKIKDSIVHYQELLYHPFNDGFVAREFGILHFQNGELIYKYDD
ncbi:MAG: hypothetical protein H6607_09580 [Flavobacteriales bacterium]|nr:hypothetical protein [Flavobacteriales bacterium]